MGVIYALTRWIFIFSGSVLNLFNVPRAWSALFLLCATCASRPVLQCEVPVWCLLVSMVCVCWICCDRICLVWGEGNYLQFICDRFDLPKFLIVINSCNVSLSSSSHYFLWFTCTCNDLSYVIGIEDVARSWWSCWDVWGVRIVSSRRVRGSSPVRPCCLFQKIGIGGFW